MVGARAMTAIDDDVLAPPTHRDHLDAIYAAHQRVEAAQRDLRDAVWAARHATPKPVTWEKIGALIGITRQGAAERFTSRSHRR